MTPSTDTRVSAGFTPGPWEPRGLSVYADQRVASVGFVARASREEDVAESQANARLIAAAPELYEALSEWLEAVGPEAVFRARRKATAALTKARAAS
jgi:hypothetical protein